MKQEEENKKKALLGFTDPFYTATFIRLLEKAKFEPKIITDPTMFEQEAKGDYDLIIMIGNLGERGGGVEVAKKLWDDFLKEKVESGEVHLLVFHNSARSLSVDILTKHTVGPYNVGEDFLVYSTGEFELKDFKKFLKDNKLV